ncbi:MAG: Fe-S cluster assembly protein SufB [Lachnospiraceae bacterium]|nr:Fe-S cluster assembly protein SufB [Lachnospiraceae bacterium]
MEIRKDTPIDIEKDKDGILLDDVNRELYDFKDEEKDEDFYKVDEGLTPDIIREISEEKNDPEWMREFRLKSLEIYNNIEVPDWGPPIDGLDMDRIVTYVRHKSDMKSDWNEVPEDIKNAFEKLGIPQAEREALAGVGAQYDSELVYHNVREDVKADGVIYTDMESALTGEYADMVKEHFMKLVPPTDHKFAALHGAVWSGGSFVYVPKGVKVDIPLQSYFRLNARGAGQFEHTLIIVDEEADLHFIEGCSAPKYNVANLHAGCVELYVARNAHLRYSTIENWSKNMYNLNTKRALVEEGGTIEWISGSFGSHESYLYPTSVLKGDDSHAEFTGVTFAGKGQNLDTGAKMIHIGRRTSSFIDTKSICKSGGISTYRSSVVIGKNAEGAKASVNCGSLMLDSISRSDTVPAIEMRTDKADVGHEAKIGRISDEAVFYLMSRGITEAEARAMIVSGFASPVSKELPLEYAAEMNNLIKLEMEGG